MTHLCIPHLAVGVGKHDTACKGERSFEKLHRRAYVRYRPDTYSRPAYRERDRLSPRPFWIQWFVRKRQRSEKAWVSRCAGVMHGR